MKTKTLPEIREEIENRIKMMDEMLNYRLNDEEPPFMNFSSLSIDRLKIEIQKDKAKLQTLNECEDAFKEMIEKFKERAEELRMEVIGRIISAKHIQTKFETSFCMERELYNELLTEFDKIFSKINSQHRETDKLVGQTAVKAKGEGANPSADTLKLNSKEKKQDDKLLIVVVNS